MLPVAALIATMGSMAIAQQASAPAGITFQDLREGLKDPTR